MLVQILLAVAVIVALFIVFVALRPSEFSVSRSTTVNASPAAVFAQVNDFHRWEAWNPWGKIDPNMKQTYEGEPAGVGAVYSWDGNSAVGAGRMTITESRPYEHIHIKLEFFRPFAGTNTTDFTFQPRSSQTDVTWSMTGRSSFIPKIFGVFMSMDKMIGGHYEKGLADLKSIAESAPQI